MNKSIAVLAAFVCLALLAARLVPAARAAEAPRSIILPKPDTSGGLPLMQALALRKSTRNYSDKAISEQDLSNLLWAAWGINREDGRHTIPTSQNKQNVRVYVAMESGLRLYDPAKQSLEWTLDLDAEARAALGGTPVTLIYAAEENYAAGMHVGSMYQNVGLYCASAGLGNVVKRSGSDTLDTILKLPEGYKVLIIQLVGWAK